MDTTLPRPRQPREAPPPPPPITLYPPTQKPRTPVPTKLQDHPSDPRRQHEQEK